MPHASFFKLFCFFKNIHQVFVISSSQDMENPISNDFQKCIYNQASPLGFRLISKYLHPTRQLEHLRGISDLSFQNWTSYIPITHVYSSCSFFYILNGSITFSVSQTKNLGVHHDFSLSLIMHIKFITISCVAVFKICQKMSQLLSISTPTILAKLP